MTKINNYEYGVLSDASYKDPNPAQPNGSYEKAEELGFKLIDTSGPREDETGYFAATFERDGKIVIASRGTNLMSEVCKVEFSNLTSVEGFKKTTKDLGDCLDHSSKDGKSDLLIAFKTLPQERFNKVLEYYYSTRLPLLQRAS